MNRTAVNSLHTGISFPTSGMNMNGMSMSMNMNHPYQFQQPQQQQQNLHHQDTNMGFGMLDRGELPIQFLNWGSSSSSLTQQQQQQQQPLSCTTTRVTSFMNCPTPSMMIGNNSICAKDGEPRIPYPAGFVPTIHHVICGRGKKSYGHIGNKNFLKIVALYMDEYAEATNKQEKSDIVQAIVDEVDAKGGFVRLDQRTGCYFKAEEGAGREKTSQALRDCLDHKYKSSKDIKRKNRKQKRIAKQAVRGSKQSDKRPSLTPSAVSMDSNEDNSSRSNSSVDSRTSQHQGADSSTTALSIQDCTVSFRSPRLSPSALPPRTVSSNSVRARAALAFDYPTEANRTSWHMDEDGVVHLVSEEPVLEPLPFRPEEVEDLPDDDMLGPFFFSL